MKKLYGLVVAALMVVGGTAAVQAIELTQGDPGDAIYPAPKATLGDALKGLADTQEMGAHELTGTVSEIDREKGLFSLKAAVGTLRLYFPPASIRELKVGEEINVELAFRLSSGTDAVQAGDAPAVPHDLGAPRRLDGEGEHTISGTVNRLDRDKGMVGLTTDQGVLQLNFPVESMRSLKDGDRIKVSLAFHKRDASHWTTK